jgi:RNase P/RNase MRP subunit POP5
MVRVKQRYFVIKIHNGSAAITEKHILESLRSIQKEYYGEIQTALMAFTLKYYSPITQLIILKCLRDHVRWIGSLIPLVCEIGEVKCLLQTIHLSGSANHYFYI